MSLKQVRQLHSSQLQELPITETVIYRVDEMSPIEGAPKMINGYFNLSGDLETQSLLDMKMKKQ